MKRFLDNARRIVVAVIGGTVLLLGVLMVVLPGPGFLVILAGIAVLATEFYWAKGLLRRVKRRAAQARRAKLRRLGQQRHRPPAA